MAKNSVSMHFLGEAVPPIYVLSNLDVGSTPVFFLFAEDDM